jgi:protein kinase-like protein
VKLLRAELLCQADLVERLRREGEVLQFLSHPNIVVSHGHGMTAAGRPYVVLEHLVGSTLRQELARRCVIPVGEAVRYARQLLSALVAVHDAGVVHRDVKPGNVMVCPGGRGVVVKLIDFGVAKVEREARRFVGPIAFPTREGICLGTPRYVSPEQARGLDVDRRTDIYAAGMLLYTLIAGRGPFDDIVGVQSVLEAHIGKEPPPPSRFMAAPLAEPIEAVILRAIAKDPAQRFADAATFRRELGRAWSKSRVPQGFAVNGSRFPVRPGAHRHVLDAAGMSRGHRGAARPLPMAYTRRAGLDRCRIRVLEAPLPRPVYGGSGGPSSCAPLDLRPDPGVIALSASPTARRVSVAAPQAPAPTDIETLTRLWSAAPKPIARASRPSISRRGVVCSAAAFFAAAVGLAMWFVR